MLITGDIDAIDTVGLIDHPLTLIDIGLPLSGTQTAQGVDGKTESLTLVVFPESIVEIPVVIIVDAVAFTLSPGHLSVIHLMIHLEGCSAYSVPDEVGGHDIMIDSPCFSRLMSVDGLDGIVVLRDFIL